MDTIEAAPEILADPVSEGAVDPEPPAALSSNLDTSMTDLTKIPAAGDSIFDTHHQIETEYCDLLNVYVQGDLQQKDRKAVFLTVHDLGCNHSSFHDFVEHPSMAEVKARSIFIHIDIPGQEDNAQTLKDNYTFPNMQQIADDLVTVLDRFQVKYVIGFGEGAGANILARFGMSHATRCLGLILVHCTSTVAGMMETVRDKFINWKLSLVGHNPSAEQYLVFHRFGTQVESAENKERAIEEFRQKLNANINPKNLRLYVEAFLKCFLIGISQPNLSRTEIASRLKGNLKVDTLLVAGTRTSHLHTVDTMYSNCDPQKTSLIKIDDVADVLNEAPEKLAHSILLFVQSQGLMSSVSSPILARSPSTEESGDTGVRPVFQRRLSMEDQDRPNIQRLLSTERRDSSQIAEAANE
ncbi:unnamed protein product [Cyprideis torosa]|uniref:Uncharacterized protein n=1 Tax=Cyprideis torosa TaxID=163714 RepID=A0A7R8ZSB4_9CRUS|nr:unnamed protein product [Cyprideis torosa]CAG0895147.1 unnamed protein product [Cyprideis torosa]